MKIAIIGSGISGLTAAYYLHKQHDITLFEADTRVGGHTATVDVELTGQKYSIDTGFIVYNDWTYPNFIRLMDEVGVASRQSDMSFSVSCDRTGLEFAGVDGRLKLLNALFAQRGNLLSPSYIGMLLDIVRFNRQAVSDVEFDRIDRDMNLRDYVARHHLGKMFTEFYLIPMASAIWSTPFRQMYDFPMRFMLPFMYRHGLLSVSKRPKWRTIVGGSRSYIDPLSVGFKDKIRLATPVTAIQRHPDSVVVEAAGQVESFDHVILACHSDQALGLLKDATQVETATLTAIRYQDNDVVLHTDIGQMPANSRAWASWNYRLTPGCENSLPIVTYDMNRLMGLSAAARFCVTLNNTAAIAPEAILRRFKYAHPIFTQAGVDAQLRWNQINGARRTWFCGAWWGKGFHEDGVVSAIRVAEALGVSVAEL
ncbi:MAG: FAD-dependent oxidoreductase [Gammaproteobacteria bacterium]|nr:FAD-dependent oxidoreductase [Gammaproteobacteria bacterium]MDP2139439.1 FAD-dependent oxidoreductase [Gammaproteobacteria bacterium]MDP2346275.1 FAD-dependent oxidoreductase [Gammaproteobacteria bacterium]